MSRRHRALASRRRFVSALAAASGATWLAGAPGIREAVAQGAADRTIRLVVGLPPGSGGDVSARLLVEGMEGALGQRIIVENRPGADGIIAVRQLMGAPPDGSVLLFGLSSQFAVNPATYASLPYDPLRDVAPVSQVAFQRTILAVHPSLPVTSVRELVDFTHRFPGTVNYASGTSTFMLMAEAFKQQTGADMLHVPFNGGGPAVLALVAGTVQAAFVVAIDSLPHVAAGRLRALAVSGSSRLRQIPDVPTFAEVGIRDEIAVWTAVFAPSGTPAAIIERTRGAIVRTIGLPEVRERLDAMAQDPVGGSPEALGAMIARDMARTQAIAKQAGVVAR